MSKKDEIGFEADEKLQKNIYNETMHCLTNIGRACLLPYFSHDVSK